MTKSELRKRNLALRREIKGTELELYSLQLSDWFFMAEPLIGIRLIHIFLPIQRNSEPDTWVIINRLKREYPHIGIVIPKIESDGEINSYLLEDPGALVENSWGIPEPTMGEVVRPEFIDLVLVPLLAFDLQGNRVGYGKGYYDRFLSNCRNSCRRVGLSLLPPEPVILDVNPHDVLLNSCITPTAYFAF